MLNFRFWEISVTQPKMRSVPCSVIRKLFFCFNLISEEKQLSLYFVSCVCVAKAARSGSATPAVLELCCGH